MRRAWLLVAVLLTDFSAGYDSTNLRGVRSILPTDNGTTTHTNNIIPQDRRILMSDHSGFIPLECNAPACNAGTTTWTAEAYDPSEGTVVIPCGRCVTMDYDETATLVLPFGLDIQGTLTFPDSYKLTIEAPFVRVQGNLIIRATQAVTGEPSIKIVLTGEDDRLTDFVPALDNELVCSGDGSSPEPCTVGSKPIVVAGGRLDVQGLPDDCKTWVLLEDVAGEQLPAPPVFTQLPDPTPNHPNPYCRGEGFYMQETFSAAENEFGWTGGYGAFFDVTDNGVFKVHGRKSATEHGPLFDLSLHMRDCLVVDQTYLFSARIRLLNGRDSRGMNTTCVETGENCLTLQSLVRTHSGQINKRKGYEEDSDGLTYGVWHDFYATFSFSEEELDSSSIYHILQLEGPEANVDIEIDDASFYLPPASVVPNPDDVCGGNLIMNGDASASSIHPYPIENLGGGRLWIRNDFFRVRGRTSDTDSVAYHLDAPGCILAGARYKVSARVRIHGEVAVTSKIVFRVNFQNGSSRKFEAAECPASEASWIVCESEFVVAEDFDVDNVDRIRFSFETVGGSQAVMDVDDWQLQFVQGTKRAIIVQEEGVSGCWDEGAELLITSHTIDLEDAQVRRLAASPQSLEGGFVRINLNEPIVPPLTRQDGFPVEVALLNRNIVFEGAPDESDSLLGGHLIVLHTPSVPQRIDGVELKNFGRQGELGRYPIHFHLCGDVHGAVVSRNSIRESNQRCVVVHGSHNLTVIENVAFETKGHCYMTEDGGELDNAFIGNLGASTRAADRLVRSVETDKGNPSTFWCSNPANEWIGNVAAGCESNGFWFELQVLVREPTAFMPLSGGMNPRRLPLKLFRDNVAHSNFKHGLRTYPHGLLPPSPAVFDNTRSFKNKQDGIFFHNSKDLIVQGGVLADNRKQADFDKADNIVIDGTSVIGVTSRYGEIVAAQAGTLAHDDIVVGLEIHSFATDTKQGGATISNVTFSGFSDTKSNHTAVIEIDGEKWTGDFDYWTTIEDVHFDGDVFPFNFDLRASATNGITNVYLIDLDSSMKPVGSSASGTSSIVSDSPEMTTFLDLSQCSDVSERGYLYCGDTCLRTITFATSPAETDGFVLRLSDKTNPNLSFDYPGSYRYEFVDGDEETLDETKNTDIRKYRYFAAALPPGNYLAEFVDEASGGVWPTFVESVVEPALCADALSTDAIQLSIPTPLQCTELIKNGDMEMSAISYPYWLHRDSGIELHVGSGVDASNAIADKEKSTSSGSIGQFLDVRCLAEGRQYDVRAWVRLERNGDPLSCDGDNCPFTGFRVRSPILGSGEDFSEFTTVIATRFIRPYDGDGWNLLQGAVTIDSRIAAATSVSLFVGRGRGNMVMYLDNLSMSLIENKCADLIFNGDFSDGHSMFWGQDGTGGRAKLEMVDVQGNTALQMIARTSVSDSINQNIRTGCMSEGNRYVATARVRLLKNNGSLFACMPNVGSGDDACPRMRLRSLGEDSSIRDIATTDHGITSDGWYTISGVFTASDFDESAEKSILSFNEAPSGKDLVIDDVSIKQLADDCTELLLNGGAEDGETALFWKNFNGDTTKIEIISDGTNALNVFSREGNGSGLTQSVDPRCLTAGSSWRFTARMKLISRSTGQAVECDPTATRVNVGCPPVRVAGYQSGAKVEDEKYFMTNGPTWIAKSFNDYETVIIISSALASCDRVSVSIRSYNLDWDLVVDDLSLTPF